MYRIVGWIASYRPDWIVSYRLDQKTLYFMRWLVTGWMGLTGRMEWMGHWWDGGGTGVGRTDVSIHRNGSATMGAGTGAPPLAIDRRQDMGRGVWRQLCQCCKDADYLCQRSKIIQIECTGIGTKTKYKIV